MVILYDIVYMAVHMWSVIGWVLHMAVHIWPFTSGLLYMVLEIWSLISGLLYMVVYILSFKCGIYIWSFIYGRMQLDINRTGLLYLVS